MNALAYYVLRVSSITFHNLQYYEALVGTLKAANRKGLIKFKGQMLGSYLQVYEYFYACRRTVKLSSRLSNIAFRVGS